jgi:uncharacterized protein
VRGRAGLTARRAGPNIPRLMSADLPGTSVPEVLDAWRMVAARRGFEGRLPLAAMTRLRDSLCLETCGETGGEAGAEEEAAAGSGHARFALDFGRDALQVAYVELRIEAALPLECQRSLRRFEFPVQVVQRLGLLRDEADEAALPEGYEPLLVPEDGLLRPAELVEDELILAVPVVAVAPGTDAMERDWPADEEEQRRASPFAALASLKRDPH